MPANAKGALAAYCKAHEKLIRRFYAGDTARAYDFFGCHFSGRDNGWFFAVWAPNALSVSLTGSFNAWSEDALPMQRYKGLWVCFAPEAQAGDLYKYYIKGADGETYFKADPYAFRAERPPGTASVVWPLSGYRWRDAGYMKRRAGRNLLKEPVSIYELHFGSWRKSETEAYPQFLARAAELAAYVKQMGFTHVELMPVNEYPYDGSWGYQVTGFFAISSRFGTPQEFMGFVDTLHKAGIGVIVDWVPAHFPKDAHGLARFDGSWLYEHENPLRREHPQWGTHIFNYNRPEVVSFLLSSAGLLFDVYHLDGIRVDAVSSMLYLDYGREKDFIRNEDGGNIDPAAVAFIRKLNSSILSVNPGTLTAAEESTAFPLVTKPPYDGGLGFLFKWNMGFMHDTLDYMQKDPLFRKGVHEKMTFSMHYAFSENFILAYSHDESVHGKRSMIEKMHGDYREKFAALRTLYAYLYAHPGKKLLFMGDEFAQFIEWNFKQQLDWFLLGYEQHGGMQRFVAALNHFYKKHGAFFERDEGWDGFTWLNVDDRDNSVFAFLRSGETEGMVCVFNFTPVARSKYLVALPAAGKLTRVLSSDEAAYGGEGLPASKTAVARKIPLNGLPYAAQLNIAPMCAVYYRYNRSLDPRSESGNDNGHAVVE